MAQSFMKRLYGPSHMWRFISDMFDSFADLRRARKNPTMGNGFTNRLLLAVTQVNGCRLCSYYHTTHAIEEGMSASEVAEILSGDFTEAPAHEHTALLFAEHYADSAGQPSNAAVTKLAKTYGSDQAAQIVAVIRMITVGNLHGNMIDALRHRLKGQKVHDSSLVCELGVVLGPILMLPLAGLRSGIRWLLGRRSRPLIDITG